MKATKPYQQVPILESGEPLVAIPLAEFAYTSPHAYEQLGAPYGHGSAGDTGLRRSPYFLRSRVLARLQQAQVNLQRSHPGWRLQIFDAYRPIAVQQFMVDYTFAAIVSQQGFDPNALTPEQRHAFLEQVYEFWAVPSFDPATPPPHSTGAAIDLTLVDASGHVVDMGSAIDETSPRSYPDYFASHPDPQAQTYHFPRQLLAEVMGQAGFQRHPNEWWHFSWGDQFWAWLTQQQDPAQTVTACYGAID